MADRIEPVRLAVEAAKREPMGDRRGRLVARARRALLGVIYLPGAFDPPPPDATAEERAAWWARDKGRDLTAAERLALHHLDEELRTVWHPYRPCVCGPNQHQGQRIAKRRQKRNARRAERRRGAEGVRQGEG